MAILAAVVAALIAALVAYSLYLLQRPRLQLGWEILSASVIIPRLRNPMPNISVAVKANLLGHEGEALTPVDEDILGFRIRIKNTGNQLISKQTVTFFMGDGAKVLSIEPETQPDLGGQQISTGVQDPTPNVATAVLPYLNPGQQVIFSLQCLGDRKTKCQVSAGAPGLVLQDMFRWQGIRTMSVMLAIALLIIIPPSIVRLLVETGTISEDAKDSISTWLLVSGVIGGVLAVVSPINLTATRPDSPENQERINKARRQSFP
jgi:hypothetical protein